MKIDPKHLAFGFGVVMLSLGLGACAGFDLGDVVKVKTPSGIQQTRGLPRTTMLNEAEAEYGRGSRTPSGSVPSGRRRSNAAARSAAS